MSQSQVQYVDIVIDETICGELPRYILMSSSRKCAELLSQNPALDRIKLSNMSVHLWEILEDFLYTGRLPYCDMHESLLLLAIATRMEISSLRSLLTEAIPSKLLRVNCVQVLRMAHEIPCEDVKLAAMEFVERHFLWVSLTKPFAQLNLELLVQVLGSPRLVIRSEVSVYEALEYWIQDDASTVEMESCPRGRFCDEYEYYDGEEADSSGKENDNDNDDDNWSDDDDEYLKTHGTINVSALERQFHLEKLLRLVRFGNMDTIDRSFLAKISTLKDFPVFIQRFASYFIASLRNPWPTSAIPSCLFSNHRILRRRNSSPFIMAFRLNDLLDETSTHFTDWSNGWRLEVMRSSGDTMLVFLQANQDELPEVEFSYQFSLLSTTDIIDVRETFEWDLRRNFNGGIVTAINPLAIYNPHSALLKFNSVVQVVVSIVESPW